jgi:hypothetical protein
MSINIMLAPQWAVIQVSMVLLLLAGGTEVVVISSTVLTTGMAVAVPAVVVPADIATLVLDVKAQEQLVKDLMVAAVLDNITAVEVVAQVQQEETAALHTAARDFLVLF